MSATPTLDVHPADTRFHTDLGWLDSRHSFNFGSHYLPDHTHHGLLLVSNDDKVAPGGGFGTHGHRDMEIVTWVLDGALEHRDSAGNEGIIRPGEAQRMTAGSGIMHSEMNHSTTESVHFVQMWVPPHATDLDPGYEQLDLSDKLAAGGLVAVASGRGHDGAVAINQRDAVLWVARLEADERIEVPAAPFVHLFVPLGSVAVHSEVNGDEAQLTAGDAGRLTDVASIAVVASAQSEVMVWEMHSSL